MLGISPNQNQLNIFGNTLKQILNHKHSLFRMAEEILWHEFDMHYKKLYSEKGMPSKPIRLMAGLLILKQIKNLSDEEVVNQWVQNPYFQFFCGESEFRWDIPCDPSDITYFRKRIGKDGFDKILEVSISIQARTKKPRNKRQTVKSAILNTTTQKHHPLHK